MQMRWLHKMAYREIRYYRLVTENEVNSNTGE